MKRPGIVLATLAVLFAALLVLIVYADTIALALQKPFAATPGPDGEITILLEDYNFSPSVIRVKAGSTVRLRLRNVGRHTHEFMLGKAVHAEDGVFEPPTPDFFEGLSNVKVEIVSGMVMPMGFGHGEEGMGEMQMGETQPSAESMPMGEGQSSGDEMDMSDQKMPGESQRGIVLAPHSEGLEMGDEHGGSMVMVNPAGEAVISFTVPKDRVGTWVFGCFQEEGLHYDAGMRGLFIVEP